MKKSDLVKDKKIKRIAVSSIDKDFDNIKMIGTIKESKAKSVFHVLGIILVTAILSAVVFIGCYVYINMKIVAANVDGAALHIGEISFVDRDYNPSNYIKSGSIVYYDGENDDSFFTTGSDYTQGTVDRVTDDKVYIQGNVKDTSIAKSRIDYVLTK